MNVIRTVIASLLTVCVACSPASAIDVGIQGDGTTPNVVPPVATSNGTVVLGLGIKRGHFDILAFSPALDHQQTVMSFGKQPEGWGLHIDLTPAGPDVLVTASNVSFAGHCCTRRYLRGSVTWFRTTAQSRQVIRSCPAPCGTSFWAPPLYYTASDGAHALMVDYLGNRTHAVVRDLASGAETPVTLDTQGLEPGGAQLAGTYLSNPNTGDIINWQTGEVVRHLSYVGAHALLADGTLVYEDHPLWGGDDHLVRLGPGENEPTPLPRAGRLLTVVNEHLLVKTISGLEVWTAEGNLISELGPDPTGAYLAFGGSRIITVEAHCMTARIETRGAGDPVVAPLADLCATPVPVRGTLARHSAAVKVTCPKRFAQGCVGEIALVKPRISGAMPRAVQLHPGQSTTVRLAHWQSRAVCAHVRRTPRWRLTVTTPNADFPPTVTSFDVPRRAAC
jgi:hypothetical protein